MLSVNQQIVTYQHFRSHARVIPPITLPPYTPTCEATRKFGESQKKIAVLTGGNRAGKSYVNIRKALEFAVSHPNSLIWLLTQNYKMIGNAIMPLILQMLPPSCLNDVAWANYRLRIPDLIRLPNGSELVFKTYESRFESLQGAAVDLVIMDEEAVDRNIFIECLARTLDKQGKVSMSFTPLHGVSIWTYEDLYLASQHANPDIDFYTTSLLDNPYIAQSEKDKMILLYGADEVARRVYGQYTRLEGAVWKELGSHNFIKRFTIPAPWRKIRVIDFGYVNPFVCLWIAVGEDRELYIYQEYYKNQTLLNEHVRTIHELDEVGVSWAGHIPYFDTTVADHDAQDVAELWALGMPTTPAEKEVIAGIQLVNRLLKVGATGRPRVYIFDDLPNLKRELQSYHYPKNRPNKAESELPDKIDDHGCDCLRYGCMFLDGSAMGVTIDSAGELVF